MTSNYDQTNHESSHQEISDFHERFRPYVNRIYRGSLILTGKPSAAKKLQTDIYLKSFLEYVHSGPVTEFDDWLLGIVNECFSGKTVKINMDSGTRSILHEQAMQLIAIN